MPSHSGPTKIKIQSESSNGASNLLDYPRNSALLRYRVVSSLDKKDKERTLTFEASREPL
jgi:hypothetical protein